MRTDIERTVRRMIATQLTSFPKSDAVRATFGQSVADVEALLRERCPRTQRIHGVERPLV